MICRNLTEIRPNFSSSHIFSLTAILLKLGLIQTLTSLCSLRPNFGCNADCLLEQSATRSDRLLESMEVESAYSSRGCFREWLAVGGEKDRFSRLFLLFYGLIVGKYALICPWKFRKFRWSFFDCITELNLSSSCWPQKRCLLIYQQTSATQNTVHLKIGFIWKFSREWLLWTVYASGGSLRKKPQSPTLKYF